MAHFAQLDESNRVLQIIVINNSDCGDLDFPASEAVGIAFCKSLFGEDTNWRQTSYNANFRTNYAAIGSVYLPAIDAFSHPQPFASWSLNETTGEWNSPIPKPEIPNGYTALWDEENQEWDVILDKAAV